MAKTSLNAKVLEQIDMAVGAYEKDMLAYDALGKWVIEHFTSVEKFNGLIHSSKSRTKDPDHLRDKLIRMAKEAKEKGKQYTVSEKNVFARIDDLAGARFLHIHTRQIGSIHPLMLEILSKFGYRCVKEPFAYTWDIENKKLFEEVGFRTHFRESMYTSTHYIVMPHYCSRRCEIQVRTLAEELWGEVSHAINYPHETDSIPCKEQLFALGRIASGCTRLVDSIFASHEDHMANQD